jgi:hypothetical protein
MGSMLVWAWPGLLPAGLTTSRPADPVVTVGLTVVKKTSDKFKPSIYCQKYSIIQARLDESKKKITNNIIKQIMNNHFCLNTRCKIQTSNKTMEDR